MGSLRRLRPRPISSHFCRCVSVWLQVSARIEELLHTAFENYFMLSEETASGMMDGALAVRSGIPAVLRPAVHLFSKPQLLPCTVLCAMRHVWCVCSGAAYACSCMR